MGLAELRERSARIPSPQHFVKEGSGSLAAPPGPFLSPFVCGGSLDGLKLSLISLQHLELHSGKPQQTRAALHLISGTYSCLFLIKSLRCKTRAALYLARYPSQTWLPVCSRADAESSSTEASAPDLNQLETQLRVAVAAEDYATAAKVKKRIDSLGGIDPGPAVSWANLGVPDWLADRTERLGYPFPTSMQQKAIKTILLGADAVIRSETGSGKTLAFLLPALAMLDYPPVTCAAASETATVGP